MKKITLRDLVPSDSSYLIEHLNNKNVVRYLSSRIPFPYTKSDADWWIQSGSKDNAMVQVVEFGGEFCGLIGVYWQSFEYSHSAEVGYWFGEAFWGKGVATQALEQFIARVFADQNIKRLYAPVFGPNTGSAKVLEKNGFALEGILKSAISKDGQFYDEFRYGLVAPR